VPVGQVRLPHCFKPLLQVGEVVPLRLECAFKFFLEQQSRILKRVDPLSAEYPLQKVREGGVLICKGWARAPVLLGGYGRNLRIAGSLLSTFISLK